MNTTDLDTASCVKEGEHLRSSRHREAECPMADLRFTWTGWEAETDLDNDDDREGVYFLTILDYDEELAVIIHRTEGDAHPLDGKLAEQKIVNAQRIVNALNAQEA